MAKSKVDKDRKAKVVAFKERVQKENQEKETNMEIPQFRPFRQVPHWEPDAKFEITASEFSVLQDYFNVFAQPIQIMQDIFGRSLNEGKITIKYIDNDNKEIPKEEVQAYYNQMREYFQKQADTPQVEVVEDTALAAAEDAASSLIVSE